MTKLQEECRSTNAEMVKWRGIFSKDVKGLKSDIAAITNVVGAGSTQAAQYRVPATMATGTNPPTKANIISGSPLTGYKADTFTGMSVQDRA